MKQIEKLIDEVIMLTSLLQIAETKYIALPKDSSLSDRYKQVLVSFCYKVAVLKLEEKNQSFAYEKSQIDYELDTVLSTTNLLMKCEVVNLNQLFDVDEKFKSTLVEFCRRVELIKSCNDN